MQVRSGVFVPKADLLSGVVMNGSQLLVPANFIPQFDLDLIQMPVFRLPAVAMIDLDMT